MKQLRRIEVIPIKGTAQADLNNYKRPQTGLVSRTKTIQVFLKKKTLDNIVIQLNKSNYKLRLNQSEVPPNNPDFQSTAKTKICRYLEKNVRNNITQTFKSIQLWGDLHYNKVMKHSNINDEFFVNNQDQIPNIKSISVSPLVKNKQIFEEDVLLPFGKLNNRHLVKIKRKARTDMNSLLSTVQKRKQQVNIDKKGNNMHKQLSGMLKKKIRDYRVSYTEVSTEEFENMRRCMSYCHIVEKNLKSVYKFRDSTIPQVNTSRNAQLLNASSVKPIHLRTMSSTTRVKSQPAEISAIRNSFEKLQQKVLDFTNDINSSDIRNELKAFEAYNQTLDNLMTSRISWLEKLR